VEEGHRSSGTSAPSFYDAGVLPQIRLVPFDRSHLEDLGQVIEDPDVLRFTRVPVPPPEDFPEMWFASYEAGRADGTREAFAIVDAGSGGFLGIAVAPRIDRETRTAELGYVIAPHARGRGVATEALRQLTAWAFETLDPMRLELLISVENDASKRVATKAGYAYEGTLRNLHVKQDLWEDGEIWSRVPTDP